MTSTSRSASGASASSARSILCSWSSAARRRVAAAAGSDSGRSDMGREYRVARPGIRPAVPPVAWHDRPVLQQVRAMPGGIRLFLIYALAILAGIGISLRSVIDLAIGAPVSGPGVIVMILLAYTIFTTTLVLQRKQAARGLALGLASLTLPLFVYLLLAGLTPQAVFIGALAALLFRGLLRPEVTE